MKVWIDESSDPRSRAVTFNSATGTATASWRGDAPPDPGEHDVELEIPGTYRWGRDVRVGGDLGASLSKINDGFRVSGRALALDSDGILWLDLDGGIVMVETDGRAPEDIVGSVIELDTPALQIYPTAV